MSEWRSLGRLAREPLYNTRAVAQTTGVPADTFRAWERRYGVPRPFRTPANRRLYAERDIGVIIWLRERTDEGMTISLAIQRLRIEYPEIFVAVQPTATPPSTGAPETERQVARLRRMLLDAVVAFDTQSAERVIDEALARCSVEAFCVQFVEPALQEIGERWSQHDLSVAAEHFATRLLTRRLAAIFTMVAPVDGRGTIVAACPPGEEHEVGLLVLAIVLSRRGWRVVYLGADVPVDALLDAAQTTHPDLVCLSVTTNRAATQVTAVTEALHARFDRLPVVVGGAAFSSGDLSRTSSGAHVITGTAVEVVDQIVDLIERR